MRPYRIGTANLLQAMIRLTLLLGPVLSSGSGLSTDADGPIITRLFEYMTESTNIEELILDPKYLYVDAPSHHNPLKDVDAYKANAFICKKCEKTDTDGCILTKLGKEICQLVAADKHEEASKHFREYLKHLNRHEIPPSLPGDGIEISWKSIPEFIGTFIMSQHVEKDDINALMHALRKYKNLPPFQLKNIVVSGADILTDYKSRENNGTNYKIKLENCNLWGI
ncbi:MAG: hypothetical protein QRY16_21945, partial [Enterobacterales bacterium endosymbiont of Blomia tropicalis]|uniref:hypothetical protein n=1 Tax=Mixta mediterraneensis TaxID=2758443 RepID=UPI0025A745DD